MTLECDAWTFDGAFHKLAKDITVEVPHGYQQNEEIPIVSLTAIPLRFDKTGLEVRPRQRGEFFLGLLPQTPGDVCRRATGMLLDIGPSGQHGEPGQIRSRAKEAKQTMTCQPP